MFKLQKRISEMPHIVEVWNEGEDGWWANLEDGWSWCDAEVHCLHESTLTELLQAARIIKRCEADCQCGHGK